MKNHKGMLITESHKNAHNGTAHGVLWQESHK